jgi:hypothetical protein
MPDTWQDMSTVSLLAEPREIFTPNLQINQEPVPQEVTLAAYFTAQREELNRGLPSFKLLGHGDRAMAGGQPALWHEYLWHNPEHSVDVHQYQLGTHFGGTIYTVTASALERDWVEVGPELLQVVETITFGG